MSEKRSIKNAIKAATLPTRSIPLCLNAELQAEYEESERQLDESIKKAPDSLAGNGAGAIADRMNALREQMMADTWDFRVKAVPRRRFTALMAEHPPTEGNADEKSQGYSDTLFDALIRECTVEPKLDADDWAELLGDDSHDGKLSNAQFTLLSNAAWLVNRRDIDVPFSHAVSQHLRTSVAE
jgi:hypothetical protein